MYDVVLGCGQGGSRIAKSFSEAYQIEGRYFNLTDVDFSKFEAARNEVFVLNEGGTGRDSDLGEKLVRNHYKEMCSFLKDSIAVTKSKNVVLCIGGGGGSGTGFMFPVIEWLLENKKQVFLVFTLPQKREGLPAQPNALRALNRLIENHVGHGIDKEMQVSPLLIDNDYCFEKYALKDGVSEYWTRVNIAIASSLKRFYNLTNLEQHKNYYDIAAGYNALDYRELMRVLYFKEGFVDVREFTVPTIDDVADIRSTIKTASLVNRAMDINTTKAFVVSVALPEAWKEYGNKKLSPFVDTCFEAADKMTRTSFSFKSSYYSPKLKTAKVSLLLAGMTRSHGLDKHIRTAAKNVTKFKEKGDIEGLSLDGLDY